MPVAAPDECPALGMFDILTVTEETAVAYAALRLALKRSGRPIPANNTVLQRWRFSGTDSPFSAAVSTSTRCLVSTEQGW